MSKIKTVILLSFMAFILYSPTRTCHYALEGLTQWATRMIPTLFPFMILSSLMICSGADEQLGKLLSKLWKIIIPIRAYGSYAIFIGFLCGFPMGAKVVSELYSARKLSRKEAQHLVGFCNNIGPAYFLGLVFPLLCSLGYTNVLPFVFGMYGIPILYGIALCNLSKHDDDNTTRASLAIIKPEHSSAAGLFNAICMNNIESILLLGGYVTLINAMRSIFDCFPLSSNIKAVLSSFLEIIGGIPAVYHTSMPDTYKVFWIMVALSFNGISCLLQTISFLEKANLSVVNYILHKLIIFTVSLFYYTLWLIIPA